MILVVDHQDSFTRNLEHLLANFDDVLVVDRKKITPTHIQDAQAVSYTHLTLPTTPYV